MIEQIFRLTVGDTNITSKVTGCSISEQMQRIYNTASFESEDNLISKSVVKIELGDKVFDGFIYSSTKNGNSKYSIQCRTFGGYMTTPFVADDTSIVIPVKTSHELCAYYAAEYGIPIIITAIDLDFGGDYEQKGTPLSALVAVANTTGADYWFDGTSIRIEPAKWIEEGGEVVSATSMFDYVPFAKTIDQRGVGTVVVGTASTDTNKTVTVSCNSKIDGCNSLATIRVVPHEAYQYSEGLSSVEPVQTPLNYTGIISMQSYLTLEADIVSISKIMIDNAVVTDYDFVSNTVVFSSPKRGRVTVNYVGWGYIGYADTKKVDGDSVASFTVFYGECEAYYYDSVLSCTGDTSSSCGGVAVIMPEEMNYVKGFTFSTFIEYPQIYFYTCLEKVTLGITSASAEISILETVVLSEYEGGGTGVRHKFKYPMNSVQGVRASGEDIPYTNDADYLYLDGQCKSVELSYTANGVTHTVINTDIPASDITMVIVGDDGQCEYSLAGANANDPNTMSCSLGDDVSVDIVGIHGIALKEVIGKNFVVTAPDGSATYNTADSFGVITIHSVQRGNYHINTDNAWPNSYIKMISYAN